MDYIDEEELFHFGTPLDPLEEDDVPKKKIAIEDQIVTDENGRRRFHGAFTGGFSAGFWNTVGSLEGWKPKSFKSSRTEKAETQICQQPKDFMDEEDLGEFGIAPQRVQARDDFTKIDSNNRKRTLIHMNRPTDQLGPILQNMLEPPKAKVAIRLLMQMGWKPGQGIGARQSRKEKELAKKRNNRELYVIQKYGCEIDPNPNTSSMNSAGSASSSEDEDDLEITFAPDDIESFACSSKDNTFGLGYSGLEGQISSKGNSHINLFEPLEVLGKDSKKLSIRGQAFGVGALEEEDEDIYTKDDMSQYDFCLGNKKKVNKKKTMANQEQGTLEGFSKSSEINRRKTAHTITINANFEPKNWLQRKSRFSKLTDSEVANIMQNNEHKRQGIGRHDIGPDERGKILCSTKPKSNNEKSTQMEENNSKHLEGTKPIYSTKAKTIDVSYIGTICSMSPHGANAKDEKVIPAMKEFKKVINNDVQSFKPFAPNTEKQERYEKFLAANLKNEEAIKTFLQTIQPIHLSEWDREMERKEFMQAQNIYKPLNGLMSERFVSKTFLNDSELLNTKIEEQIEKKVINVQRTKAMWKPCSLICKRFNIPEPFVGVIAEPKIEKKGKFSIFDYIENSMNSKKDFVTPVIIPKHMEKPKEIQENNSVDINKKMPLQNIPMPDSKMSLPENLNSSRQLVDRKTKGPKSELEIKIEEYKHKHPSEKKDLFKSIFDSSSESDTESNICENSETEDRSKISSEIVEKLIKPSSASRNILKNNSPPRGIFASLLSAPTTKVEPKSVQKTENQNADKIVFKPFHERECTRVSDISDDMYGPKLPQSMSLTDSKASKEKDYDKKIMELLSTTPSEIKHIEKWVEKKHSSKHKKKHKKDVMKKSKHKKKKKKSHKND